MPTNVDILHLRQKHQKCLKTAILSHFRSFLAKQHIRDTPEHSRILDIFGKSANIKLSNKKNKGKELKMTTQMTFDEYDTIIVTY